ncbi:MAG: nuclear transport factor 2 family protein [Fibrobacteria bacterium]
MVRFFFGKSQSISKLGILAFPCFLAFSSVSADRGAPPPAGKGYQEAQNEARCDRSGKNASAVVQEFYDKLGKGDLPGMMATFAKDAKWVLYGPSGIPFAGVHEGKDGVQAFIETFGANAKVTRFEPREFIADKQKVVYHGYEEATAIPTGKSWKAHWTHSFTLERGKIVLVEEVLDTAPVLAAFLP